MPPTDYTGAVLYEQRIRRARGPEPMGMDAFLFGAVLLVVELVAMAVTLHS